MDKKEVKKITIKLDEISDSQVREIAKRQNKPVTLVVKTAIKNELARDNLHSTDINTTLFRQSNNIEKLYRKVRDNKKIGLKEIEAMREEHDKLCERLSLK